MPKINKIGQCFTELLKKQKWHFYVDRGVEGNNVFA